MANANLHGRMPMAPCHLLDVVQEKIMKVDSRIEDVANKDYDIGQ